MAGELDQTSWENRSFSDMAGSTGAEVYNSPWTGQLDAARRQQVAQQIPTEQPTYQIQVPNDQGVLQPQPVADQRSYQQPAAGEQQPVQQAGQFTVTPDGIVHRTPGSYGAPSGLVPTADGHGVIIPQTNTNTGLPGGEYNQTIPAYGTPGGAGGGLVWHAAPDQMPGAQLPTVGSPEYNSGSNALTNADYTAPFSVYGNRNIDAHKLQVVAGSLHGAFNPDSYYVEAAIGGLLGTGVVPRMFDKLVSPDAKTGFGGLWNQHYSPRGLEIRSQEQLKQVQTTRQQDARDQIYGNTDKEIKGYVQDLRERRGPITAANQKLDQAIADLKARAATPAGISDAEQRKLDLFTEARKKWVAVDKPVIDAAAKPVGDSKIVVLDNNEANMLRYRYNLFKERQDVANNILQQRKNINGAQEAINKIDKGIDKLKAGEGLHISSGFTTSPQNPNVTKFVPRNFLQYHDENGRVLGQRFMQDAVREDTNPIVKNTIGTWRGNSLASRVGEGMAVASIGLLGDALADKVIFGKDQYPDNNRIFQSLEGPALAAAMLLPENPAPKLGYSIAAITIPKLADKFIGSPPNATYSELLKPNAYQAIGMAAGWMMPGDMKPLTRVGAVAAGWALGPAMNALDSLGIPVPFVGDSNKAARMYDQTTAAVNDMEKNRSTSNFKNVVQKAYNLAMENEASLPAEMYAFEQKHAHAPNTPQYWQTHAALDVGGADMWLKRGTKLNMTDANSHNTDGRILAGLDLDLGGQATRAYRDARNRLGQAEQYLTHNGGSSSEINAVKEQEKLVQDRLSVIYGPHDLQKAYDEIINDNSAYLALSDFGPKLRQQVASLNTNDNQYHAKMLRDLALVDIVLAGRREQGHADGVNAATFYQEAARALQVSMQLDPNAADNTRLKQIVDRVGGGIQGAIDSQAGNTINNPYGLSPQEIMPH